MGCSNVIVSLSFCLFLLASECLNLSVSVIFPNVLLAMTGRQRPQVHGGVPAAAVPARGRARGGPGAGALLPALRQNACGPGRATGPLRPCSIKLRPKVAIVNPRCDMLRARTERAIMTSLQPKVADSPFGLSGRSHGWDAY